MNSNILTNTEQGTNNGVYVTAVKHYAEDATSDMMQKRSVLAAVTETRFAHH